MVQQVTLSIDGMKVQTAKGNSVLDAAVEHGICIPHLCHVPMLCDIGACRICIVEHVRNGRSKITASCTLLAQEGMVIRANSERVQNLRRNVAELLVTEAPNSRAVQDIAVRCGVKETRYPFRNEGCILCGRCTRVCAEVPRAKAIGFLGRGKDRHVDFPFSKRPEVCKLCGECTKLCPMSVTPCEGPMTPGHERLCARCESTIQSPLIPSGICFRCDLGQGFSCARHSR